jgi:hypothetical protein
MSDYGSVPGVQAYVRHITLDTPNNPSTDNLNTWLTARSAQLTGWLAIAGYTVPVTNVSAKAILDRYANLGAACDAEMAQRTGGYGQAGKPEQNQRGTRFCEAFSEAEAFINSGALQQLGAEHSDAAEAPSALSFVPATYGATPAADEYARPIEYWP